MTVLDTRVVGYVAAIDFRPVGIPSVWFDIVLQRDLAPFVFTMTDGDDDATPSG